MHSLKKNTKLNIYIYIYLKDSRHRSKSTMVVKALLLDTTRECFKLNTLGLDIYLWICTNTSIKHT